MDQQKIEMYLFSIKKYIPEKNMVYLRDRLLDVDESKLTYLSSIEMKDPTTLLLISLFLGGFGVDRFMLEETGMGVLKLLTGGVCGILSIIDLFTVQQKTKELNFKRIQDVLAF